MEDVQLPPRLERPDGRPRRVGVEIEYAGPEVGRAAALVQRCYGGRVEVLGDYRRRIADTRYGDFTVELDMSAAHAGDEAKTGKLAQQMRSAVGEVGRLIMPFEVVSPPVRLSEIAVIDHIVTALREAGAEGTEGSLFYAFGLHLNPEVPDGEADTVLDHLKAYLLLSPWLRSVIGVDLARRIAPFVARFPEAYTTRVVDPGYRPDLTGLIRDYAAWNPSRNRELDLYPLFATMAPGALDRERLGPLVKPRPTFHYRLPDSRVGVAGWSVVPDWNRWVEVERLAADRGALDALGALWCDCARRGATADWHRLISRRMAPGGAAALRVAR
jgi:hypothetical protein